MGKPINSWVTQQRLMDYHSTMYALSAMGHYHKVRVTHGPAP